MNSIKDLLPGSMRERTFQLKARRDAGAVWNDPQFVECKKCGRRATRQIWNKAQYVCPNCGVHLPIGGYYRLSLILDHGSFRELDEDLAPQDVLEFPGYPEKLAAQSDKTGLKEKLDEAKAIGPDGVTEGSYEKLQNAIQEAEGVYNDPNASQDAVNQQIQKLIGAISGLKPVLSGLEVSDPVKTEYAVGERLDTTGMTVTAQYSDGTTVTLASGQYTVSGFDSATAGEKQVTVSYTEGGVTKTAAFTVTVKESSGSSEDPGSSEGPGTGSSGSESGGTESGTGSGTENNNNAQTGDGMTVPIILLSLLVAASAGIAVVLGKKRRLG